MLRIAVIAGLALVSMGSPAQAQDVARVELGSTIDQLIAGPDGGAWVTARPGDGTMIGHASADGRYTTQPVHESLGTGAIGPDGSAWFPTGQRRLVRAAPDGTVSRVAITKRIRGPLASGPDGTLWSPLDDRLARVTTQGAVTTTELEHRDECAGLGGFSGIERASDGAVWIAENGCEQLLRIGSAATTVMSVPGTDLVALAADAGGGMWFTGDGKEIGHVSASGAVTRHTLPRREPAGDVAVGPDGSAWVATGTCELARITPAGEVTTVRAPVPATLIAFAPDGRQWLASRNRIVRVVPGAPPGACDDRPPRLRVTPAGGRISVGALRRSRLGVAVREPALLFGVANFAGESADGGTEGFESGQFDRRVIRGRRGGSARLRVAASDLRRLERAVAAGRRWTVRVEVVGFDAEGNPGTVSRPLRVTR
jgi:streptogramin lyase